HALNKRGDRARRGDLADQVDVADVYSELERCRGNQRLELASFQSLLRIQPLFARETAVVRGDLVFAQALRQCPRDALGQPPGVDEYQGRAVLADHLGKAIVELGPYFSRHDGFERRFRNLDRQIAPSHVAAVDDGAGPRTQQLPGMSIANQKTRDLLDWLLGRG